MAVPPRAPLPHLLATVAEVRRMLASVPPLIALYRWADAAAVIDEARAQLAELAPDLEELPPGAVPLPAIAGAEDLPGAAGAVSGPPWARSGVCTPPLPRPGGRPGEPPMASGDQPLW